MLANWLNAAPPPPYVAAWKGSKLGPAPNALPPALPPAPLGPLTAVSFDFNMLRLSTISNTLFYCSMLLTS
jgi:hypothetical protein